MSEGVPRFGVIGARRARQGVGEHLARFVHEEGGRVVAIAGTSAASVAEALRGLRRHGIEASGHDDVRRMLAVERLDALVIASPAPLHERHLRAALDAGVHVLCEKPFVWRRERLGDLAAELAKAFRARRLHLMIDTQWPKTLDAYVRLLEGGPIDTRGFEMRLCPSSSGYEMLVDAMPHPLSLLHELLELPRSLLRARLPTEDRDDLLDALDAPLRGVAIAAQPERIEVRFDFPLGGRTIPSRVLLERCPEPPRPASYGFGGRIVHRVIREPGYRLAFRAEGSLVDEPIEDPTRRRVWEFVNAVAAGASPGGFDRIVHEARHLEQILAAWKGPIGVVGGEERG